MPVPCAITRPHALVALLAAGLVLAAMPGGARAQRAPVIEHIEPTSGPPGSDVHIIGRRLGEDVRVDLGARRLRVVEALPNRVIVRIPEGASTATLSVTNAAGASARGPEFRVTPPPPMPLIESFTPRSGPPGTEIVVVGENFSPRLTGNHVTLGGAPVVVRSATPTRLVLTAPDAGGVGDGVLVVRVAHAGEASSAERFTLTAATAITELVPRRGAPGSKLIVRGTGFSDRAADNRVFIRGTALPVTSARPTELVVTVPQKAVAGRVLVDVNGGGRAESAMEFSVQHPPVITAVEPLRGAPGSVIELRGEHFGSDASRVDARLGRTPLEVRAVAPTRLSLVVPEGARDGKLSLSVAGVGPATWRKRFDVVPRVSITGFTPGSAPAGHVVVIEGRGFSRVRARNRVRVGDRPARVLSASETRLEVRVPAGPSGPLHVATAAGGSARTTRPLIVTVPPRVSHVSPSAGGVGTELSIHGSGFGSNAAVVRVTLGGHPLEVRSVRDDLVVATVTPGAEGGPLRVAIPLQGAAEVDWTLQPGPGSERAQGPAK